MINTAKQCLALGNEGGEWDGEEYRGKLSYIFNIYFLRSKKT